MVISDLSGGRNGVDNPVSVSFPKNQCAEAMNVDFRNGGLGRKRGGLFDVIGGTTGNNLTTPVFSLLRHVPAGDETGGMVYAFESATPQAPNYIPGASATDWDFIAAAILFDGNYQNVTGTSFNGQFYIFYDSPLDRLKVHDPNTGVLRYVGLPAPVAAPTVANQGVGAYAAVARQYRIRWVHIQGANTARVSEPSASVAFTPSGGGLSARVTRPAVINEGETHWDVEVATDSVNFYKIARTAIATAFFDDAIATTSYSSFEFSEVLGTYTLIPSAKFGVTDGNRLIVAGNYEGQPGSRVWWGPVLGSLDRGDAERMFQTATVKPYIDLDTKNGGDITGLGNINGVIYVFKFRQVWRLTPTGNILAPYQARRLTGTIGAVFHKSIALGEDSYGNPCLYFMSHKGPYRVGPNGIEYIGRDIEDLTRTKAGRPNINNTATIVVSHSVFHADVGQWWLWFASGTSNSPNNLCILDVKKATRRDEYGVRNGWSRADGEAATAICSCMGNYTLAATASLRPWIGVFHATNPIIAICDRDDIQSDRGTPFKAYVTTRSLGDPERFGRRIRAGEAIVVASHHTAADVSLRLTYSKDFGTKTVPSDLTMLAADIDDILIDQFSGAMIADALCLQLTIGDAAAVANQWEINNLQIDTYDDGEA